MIECGCACRAALVSYATAFHGEGSHAHTVARIAVGGGRPTISLSFDSRGNREVDRTRRPKGDEGLVCPWCPLYRPRIIGPGRPWNWLLSPLLIVSLLPFQGYIQPTVIVWEISFLFPFFFRSSKGFSHGSKEKSDRFSFLIRSYFLFHFTNELQGNQQIAFERCEFFVGIMVGKWNFGFPR